MRESKLKPGWKSSKIQRLKYRTYLIFGAPGSGKGTQGLTLGTLPRFYHCACGDVFRSIDTRTPIGGLFMEYSSRGELVPDDVTIALWQEAITAKIVDKSFKPDIDVLILDGIPRNRCQAELMEEMIQVQRVFHLVCRDREMIIHRLKKRALKDNRLDDANEEVIRRRLETYERETKPVLDYYGKDKIEEIDATQTPSQVLVHILNQINPLEADHQHHSNW